MPRDRLIVIATHIPLLDYADQDSTRHQVAQVKEVYELLEGREAIALGGHTHSLENLRAGDSLQGWSDVMGVDELPFTHITAGAISGDWFSGALLPEGYPAALQRDGGQPGVLTLDITGTRVKERFTVRGEDDDHQMALVVSRADLANTTWLTTNFWMGSTGWTVTATQSARTRPRSRPRTCTGASSRRSSASRSRAESAWFSQG